MFPNTTASVWQNGDQLLQEKRWKIKVAACFKVTCCYILMNLWRTTKEPKQTYVRVLLKIDLVSAIIRFSVTCLVIGVAFYFTLRSHYACLHHVKVHSGIIWSSSHTHFLLCLPCFQATPDRKAQEMTCWLVQAYDELLEGWDSTEGESYSERYNVCF